MKQLTVVSIFALVSIGFGQVPTVPDSGHAAFRANLNTSLQRAADINRSYTNPSWIVSLPFAKLSGVPAFSRTDQANTWTTGAQDMSGATHFRVPNAAGYTPTLNGHFGYDTTANAFKGYTGASVHTFAFLDSNITGTAAGLSGTALGGDVTNSGNTVTVTKINGIAVSGTPSVGYVPTATSSTTATWQAQSGGGGGGVSITDFVTTKTSGTVITISPGRFRYGTNVTYISSPITYTLQQIAVTSITTGPTLTRINTGVSLANVFVSGNTVAVQLVGCPSGTGVFVGAWRYDLPNGLDIYADTSAGCSFTSGTIGAQTGGNAIIFGNSAGQIELSHSAAMGALVTTTSLGAVATQTATGEFPNGSVPLSDVTVTAGAFDTVSDFRAFLSNQEIQSGQGIEVTMFGGQAQVGVASNVALVDQPSTWVNSVIMKDATKTLPWRTGTGSPNARDNCASRGEAYFQTDTPALWACTATGIPGTWAKVSSL